MKILLIYPQYAHSSEFDSRAPAMSLFYLAAQLERSGHKVVIYDASLGPIVKTGRVFRYGVSEKELDSFLSADKFDLAGITCSFTARWRFVAKIARQVKEINPAALVAVGGLFPTSQWQYCMDSSPVDFIMLGEAELSFARVVENIAAGAGLNDACKNVDGVVWRKDGQLCCNPKREYNDNLEDLPFPSWHLASLDKYFSLQKRIFELKVPCLPILSSRSCPNRCRFCNMYITQGLRWRSRPAENVLDEMGYLIKRFNVHNFYFIDDNFSLGLERAKEICRGIIQRQFEVKYNFHNGLSIKTIDEELVRLMRQSGCTSVCLAIESGSERIRNQVYGKKLKRENIFEVFRWFRKEGIPTIGYFLVGAPGEKRADFEETKKLLAELPMSLATVGIFTPYPGTELYDECKKNGWLREPDAEDENRVEVFSPMLDTPDFKPQDVAKWQRELYISFIRRHWPALLKEALRPGGVVNLDMFGKFVGLMKFKPVNNN